MTKKEFCFKHQPLLKVLLHFHQENQLIAIKKKNQIRLRRALMALKWRRWEKTYSVFGDSTQYHLFIQTNSGASASTLRKQPFLLAPRCWVRFTFLLAKRPQRRRSKGKRLFALATPLAGTYTLYPNVYLRASQFGTSKLLLEFDFVDISLLL